MEQLKNILKSRTVITVLLAIAFNIFQMTSSAISPELANLINAILLALAGYFRINLKQQL